MRPKRQAKANSAPQTRSADRVPVSMAIPYAYGQIVSPAHRLQQALAHEFDPAPIRKWPPAATLAFVLTTCGGFWAGAGVLLAHLI